MSNCTSPAPVVLLDDADELFVGPCGCPACEKWADCDYCGRCTPEPPRPERITGPDDAFHGPRNRHESLSEFLWGDDPER